MNSMILCAKVRHLFEVKQDKKHYFSYKSITLPLEQMDGPKTLDELVTAVALVFYLNSVT